MRDKGHYITIKGQVQEEDITIIYIPNIEAPQYIRLITTIKGEIDSNTIIVGSLVVQMVKNSPVMRETWVQSLGLEDSLKEGIATHSSILAQGQRSLASYIQSMRLQRVRHD